MPASRAVYLSAWGAYAVVAIVHLVAMLAHAPGVCTVTQPLANPLLILALLAASTRADRTTVLVTAGLACSWMADLLPPFVPGLDERALPAVFFLPALILLCAALAPLWARNRDPLRHFLIIPYGGIVIGLFLAFEKGAGSLLPLLIGYAIVLAVMVFLASGVNALTWTGGTVFMLSNALLGMVWFLPGAWLPNSAMWVMATYFLAQALIVAGLVQTLPQRRWATAAAPPAGPVFAVAES